MFENEVREKFFSLLDQRIIDAEKYWQQLGQEQKNFLLGTAMLIDGNIEGGLGFLRQLPFSFEIGYNQLVSYKMHNRISDYEKLHAELSIHYKNQLEEMEKVTYKKKVAYFLVYLGHTGAVKMLLLHKKWLEEKGFEVTFYVPYEENGLTITHEVYDKQLIVHTYKNDQDLRIIANQYDIAVAPTWDHLFPLYRYFKKVFFFSQGDYTIYSNDQNHIDTLHRFYWLPNHLFTVSTFLHKIIHRKTLRSPSIVPCGLDLNVFQPGPKFDKTTILVVGRLGVEQKRIKETLTHLLPLKDRYPVDIVWVSPEDNLLHMDGLKTFVNPTQQELSDIYRKSHIYVSGSEIESFSLPPLEAMASGTLVVSANNGGIMEYAKQGSNCLLFDVGDYQQMALFVEELLTNQHDAAKLRSNGLAAAQKYEEKRIKEQFMAYIEHSLNHTFIKELSFSMQRVEV